LTIPVAAASAAWLVREFADLLGTGGLV